MILSSSIALTRAIKTLKLNGFVYIYMLAFFLIFCGSLYFESPLQRTFSDSFRYIVFSWFIIIGYNYNNLDDKNFMKLIFSLACIQVFLSFMVFFEPLHGLIDPFKGRLSSGELSFHFYRFSGTLGYPTEFGCFLVLPIMHLVRSNLFISDIHHFIILIICILGVFLSVSRGALLVLGIFIFLNLAHRFLILISTQILNKKFLYLFISVLSVLIFLLPFIITNNEKLSYTGYLFSITDGLDSSLIHRFNELRVSTLILSGELSVPLGGDRFVPFGFDSMESFWGSSIIRFGWLGLSVIILLTSSFIAKYIFLKKYQKISFSGSVILWFCFSYLFVSPFSEVIFRSKGSVIFGLILGMALSCLVKLRRERFTKYSMTH
jgi:hypothetical protein